MNIAVVGGGRMGLPLASVFAEQGANVVVCDVNPAVVDAVNAGRCPYEEPDLDTLMAEMRRFGRLAATTDTTAAVGRAETIVVIVPARLTAERDIDLSTLEAASAAVGRGLRRGALVVYETTVAVGSTRHRLLPALEAHSGLRAGADFLLAFSPERVKANTVLARLRTTPKIVGGLDVRSTRRAGEFYARYLGAPVDDVGTLEAAEMTKLLGMLYRDVNIALANELAAFCEMAGIDFTRARLAANSDGEAHVLVPGIGVGGHCTPVYPYFLTRESRRQGLTQRLSESAREINDEQPRRLLARLARLWRPLRGERVHLLGLGFRPEVKVDTLSPAHALRAHLEEAGALVTIEDPLYTSDELRAAGFEPGHIAETGAVILVTAHPQYANPDFRFWRSRGVEVVLDGRNFWSADTAEQAGLLYLGVGRSARTEPRVPSLALGSSDTCRADGTSDLLTRAPSDVESSRVTRSM
jgi:nucleotide sugar dehydrogenase